ncbi:two-component regulator propeller domain-containing protein [Anaerophaga thermohalophila]|uniref:two-component regulator propeller domain-containing protein n=1 Tax=Anaerophaga thermohalophila TaxID=177400 RepID=UPI00138A16E2|nr:two-component regulator propeller domain-containing protein [Anaerophaga thermohalophila]
MSSSFFCNPTFTKVFDFFGYCFFMLISSFRSFTNKNFFPVFLFFFSFLALPTTGVSQYEHFRFDYLTTRSGLSQNHVNCIFQDHDGFIWIGTYNGLNRYDGYNIKSFHSSDDSDGLTQDAINVIFQDSQGFIWIGTDLGLNKYNPSNGIFSHYYNLNPDSTLNVENNIRTIYEDSNANLWVGFYGGGIKIFDPVKEKFLKPETLPGEEILPGHAMVNDFYVDQSGNYWLGTENAGLVEYHPQTKKIIRHFSGNQKGQLSDDLISCITRGKDGNLWIGTWNGGINIYNPSTGLFYPFKPDGAEIFTQKPITSLLIENDIVWIGTMGGGVYSYNTSSGEIANLVSDSGHQQGLNCNIVWTIFKDISGVIWLGTYGGGVNMFYPGSDAFYSYRVKIDGHKLMQSSVISTSLELSDNKLLLGILGEGVILFDRKTETFLSVSVGRDALSLNVRFLFQDKDGDIWISTDKGVYLLDEELKQKEFFPLKKGEGNLGDKSVYSIFQDNRGNIWFGLWGAGVRMLPEKDLLRNTDEVFFRSFDNAGFVGNTVWDFYQDKQGQLWIGAGNGVYRYDYKKEEFVHELVDGSRLTGFSISSFSEDVINNRLVIGTYGRGVAFLDMDDGSLEFIDEHSGLLRNEVLNLYTDSSGNLWICTSNGLSRYDPRNGQFRHINVEMGMQENELLNDFWSLTSGEILVGSNYGFYIFNPSGLVDSPFEPNIVITDFQVNNEERSLIEHDNQLVAVLRPYENTFSFEFAALDFRMSNKIEYQYKLDGFDPNWIDVHAGNRRVTYTNMDGGSYVFKVRASNSDGQWTGKERRVFIDLAKPFYKRLGFKAIFVVFLVVLIFVFAKVKEQKVKARLQKRNDLYNLDLLRNERDELDNRLKEKEKEFASVKVFIREKEERLLALRDQIAEALQMARPEVKKTVGRFLGQIEREINELEARQEYLNNINLLYGGYIERLAKTYPRLSQKDLLICAYIKSGKSNKDIAVQMAISSQSVEMSRYRIRKKMNLDSSLTLNDFLVRF